MPKGLMIVHTRPTAPDRAAELNEWYDRVHVPDISAVPGITAAHRYAVCDPATGEPDPDDPSFVAVYEIDAEDLQAPLREMGARSASGRHQISDALQQDPPPTVTFCRLMEP